MSTFEFCGLSLRVIEAYPHYYTPSGPRRLIYAVKAESTSKNPRVVALEEGPFGLRVIESGIRELRIVRVDAEGGTASRHTKRVARGVK